MQAFLEPEIFEGAVTLRRMPVATSPQLRLVGDEGIRLTRRFDLGPPGRALARFDGPGR